MENEFKKIIALLEKININQSKNIVPTEELHEEYQNIKDLTWLNKTAMEHLDLLKKTYSSSVDEIMEQICYLNVKLNTYVWHTESIRDITEKFITENKND